MKKFLLGKKIGMTQIFTSDGNVTPVTVVRADPCKVIKKKTLDTDKYEAIVLGNEKCEERVLNKPDKGQFFSKDESECFKKIIEFRGDIKKFEIGDYIGVSIFNEDEKISVQGISIGKGFSGTIRRHNFKRGPMTHGSKSHRIPGSIGGGTTPGRVLKGKKMAGRMGNSLRTIKNLSIVKIDEEMHLIYIKGAVPGKPGGLLKMFNKGK